MAGDDRLSDLPDKILRRILHFAPAKEASSARALSRRWRSPLLRSSGAVNLETHVEDYDRVVEGNTWTQERKDALLSRRDAFVCAAEAALDAAADGDHVTRLSLLVQSKFGPYWAETFLLKSQDWDVITRLLSHRAARRVEELRLAGGCVYNGEQEKEIAPKFTGVYKLSLPSLPSEALRVLELVDCDDILPPAAPAAVFFPRLSCLRLRRSAVHLNALQSLIDSAPTLATLHLEAVRIESTDDAKEAVLRCPAATVLVLVRCNWTHKDRSYHGREDKAPTIMLTVLDVHAPRLRRFVYKGLLRQFSLSPPSPDLTRADLHFWGYPSSPNRGDEDTTYSKLTTFWGFLQNLSSAKGLKLRVKNLEDIAVLNEARRVELLPAFSNLECLELQGIHRPKGKTAAVAIANLLRCSLVLRHLRINLTPAHPGARWKRDYEVEQHLAWKFEADRNRSLDLINRCRVLQPATISLERDTDDAEVYGTPGMSRHSFECLQTSLRKLSLQFRFEGSNCFGFKLIRFFVKNAIVLEEMHIDGGNAKLCQHSYKKIETWICNSMKRRRSAGSSSFVVLPLKRGF